MLAYKTNKIELSLKSLSIEFNIETLEFRRQYNDLFWLHYLLNSKIDCPKILAIMLLNVPNFKFRSISTFYVPTYKKNY